MGLSNIYISYRILNHVVSYTGHESWTLLVFITYFQLQCLYLFISYPLHVYHLLVFISVHWQWEWKISINVVLFFCEVNNTVYLWGHGICRGPCCNICHDIRTRIHTHKCQHCRGHLSKISYRTALYKKI